MRHLSHYRFPDISCDSTPPPARRTRPNAQLLPKAPTGDKWPEAANAEARIEGAATLPLFWKEVWMHWSLLRGLTPESSRPRLFEYNYMLSCGCSGILYKYLNEIPACCSMLYYGLFVG